MSEIAKSIALRCSDSEADNGKTAGADSLWTDYRLGDFMALMERRTPVAAARTYPMAGVYSFGRGLFERAALTSEDTAYAHLNQLLEGDFVVSRLKAWEGAVAVVPRELGGHFLSPEFPTYSFDPDIVLPSYWSIVCSRPWLWSLLATTSRGMGGRRERVHKVGILDLRMALPPLNQQRWIVDLIQSVDSYIDSLEMQVEATRAARSALLADLLSNPGDGWRDSTLGEVAVLEYGKPLKESDRDGEGFPVFSSAGEVGRHSKPLVEEGPVVIVGRKGTAGAVHWSSGPCSVIDTAYWVRITDVQLRDDFAFLAISSLNLPRLSAQTGVPGLNRDRAYSQRISVPPMSEQRQIVDLVGSIDEQVDSLESQVNLVQSLRGGIVSELLSGERLLDESYDMAVSL